MKRESLQRKLAASLLPVLLIGASVSVAQDRVSIRGVSANVEALRLDAPLQAQTLPGYRAKLSPEIAGATGSQQVIVRLSLPAVGSMDAGAPGARMSQKVNIENEQAAFLQRCGAMAPDMRVIARTQVVLNALFVEVDAAMLPELAKDPAVTRIAPVANYELDLSETVPYIGASAVQAQGFDGSGVRVAVLDSGIDYTHANMGGDGTLAAYAAAYGVDNADPLNTTRDGLFPTAKVVDGYDFVGEVWPFGPLAPDEDPIDFEGHGSHVADIIGGVNGVAPSVDLYAVKVCSAVSSSCSGVALIQGMEFAADPNGDGDPEDRVDIINMSLGSNYGQPFDDDLVLAVENATALGILTVASAGNSADKPYITGTPAAAPSALSVAQTQVPSAALQLLAVGGAEVPAVFQAWSTPLDMLQTGPLQYGDGAGGNLNGCAPFAAGSLSGQIVLVDRGGCFFTTKIFNIGNAGGLVGIIGLVAPGAPFSGGFADPGGPVTIPGFMINQADSNFFKTQAGMTASADPGNQLPLVMQMVGSSSRGPSNQYQMIKPEIGAPGASLSLEAGTGTGETPFGGTSGAAPMVAGSAALLLDAACWDADPWYGYPRQCPHPVLTKARLVTTGERDIQIDPFAGLAEITRIGGGEVRVDRALNTSVTAWDELELSGAGALSFGFVDVARETVRLRKKLRIAGVNDKESRSNETVTYTITPTFRYPEDAASGAIVPAVSSNEVTLTGDQQENVSLTLTINGALLPGNSMNSGSNGANGAALTANEFDGYLLINGSDGSEIALPWQVLPRKAARVRAPQKFRSGGFPTTVGLNNNGVGAAQIDGYSLLAVSDDIPRGNVGAQSPTPDIRAVGVTTIPVGAGFCSADESFLWAFAVNTHERQSHLLPVIHIVSLDTDQDGVDDYQVLNSDLNGPFSSGDGRQVTWAVDLATGDASAFFFTEHATNTANTALLICGEQIGLSGADLLTTNVDVSVEAFDFYFGGPGDLVDGLTITPAGERYVAAASDIAGNDSGTVDIFDFGTFPGNTEELGVMLFTNGDRGAGNRGGATEKTEAILIRAR